MIMFYDSTQISCDERCVEKYVDKSGMGRIYKSVLGVDKWSCEQNMNKNSNYEQIVNKSLFLILLQFPGSLLFYWVLSRQI